MGNIGSDTQDSSRNENLHYNNDEERSMDPKRIYNRIGDQQCFLNSMIQALVHIPAFREEILSTSIGKHELWHQEVHGDTKTCLLCEIQNFFTEYKFGNISILDPQRLRKAMSEHTGLGLNQMHDAGEALEFLLCKLHEFLVDIDQQTYNSIDVKDSNYYDNHSSSLSDVFGLSLMEQHVCSSCGGTSEPGLYRSFIYHCNMIPLIKNSKNRSYCKFETAVHNAELNTGVKCCNNTQCNNKLMLRYTNLLQAPQAISLGLVWDYSVDMNEVFQILNLIPMELEMERMFQVSEYLRKDQCHMMLRSIIVYSGAHYITFVYDPLKDSWNLFDDSIVKKFTCWTDVKYAIYDMTGIPSVLIYENTIARFTLKEQGEISSTSSNYDSAIEDSRYCNINNDNSDTQNTQLNPNNFISQNSTTVQSDNHFHISPEKITDSPFGVIFPGLAPNIGFEPSPKYNYNSWITVVEYVPQGDHWVTLYIRPEYDWPASLRANFYVNVQQIQQKEENEREEPHNDTSTTLLSEYPTSSMHLVPNIELSSGKPSATFPFTTHNALSNVIFKAIIK